MVVRRHITLARLRQPFLIAAASKDGAVVIDKTAPSLLKMPGLPRGRLTALLVFGAFAFATAAFAIPPLTDRRPISRRFRSSCVWRIWINWAAN
jgi:hypothetical protein